MAKRSTKREPRFRFAFHGWANGWYMLRLPTRRLPALDVHAYENDILDWLIEQDITPNDLSYLANGNTGDGPVVPAAEDGFMLCLLLRHAVDVLRFEMRFGARGVTPETIYAALRAEASVHKFVLADLALVAFDAIRRFTLVFGAAYPTWLDMTDDEQQFFLQLVREYLEHPDWSAEQLHGAWVDRRLVEGWRYAAEADFEARRHPGIVPFAKLSAHDQAETRLTASVIASLAPMLRS